MLIIKNISINTYFTLKVSHKQYLFNCYEQTNAIAFILEHESFNNATKKKLFYGAK